MNRSMEWLLITARPDIAGYAEASGVHRIMVDMEVLGKTERQGHLDTHKASHTFADVSAVRDVLTTSELMVRVNPLHCGSRAEVAEVVARGADRLMLPMFTLREEVEAFRAMVPANTPITYLAETPAALARTTDWTRYLRDGDEVHFGLNDLSLGMGLDFLFECLAGNVLQSAAAHLTRVGIPFGIGGVARAEGGDLPATCILGEHVRLGSTRAILSRAFHGSAASLEALRSQLDLHAELAGLRSIVDSWSHVSDIDLTRNLEQLATCCYAIAAAKRAAVAAPRSKVA